MANANVGLDELKLVQARLPALVRSALNEDDRRFLINFKRGIPNWSQVRHHHAEGLPAVRWKQHNLDRMTDKKRDMAVARLEALLAAAPEPREDMSMAKLEKTPQRQLADRIAQQLVASGLISAERRADVEEKIAKGRIRPDDWSLLIETANPPGRPDA